MKIKNKTKRLIVLNYKENGKIFKSLHLGAGAEVENEHLTEDDVAHYVGKKAIEVVGATTDTASGTKKTDPDPVVLPEEVNEETLKAMTVADLKRYCKENGIKKYSALDEAGIIALILASLEPKE